MKKNYLLLPLVTLLLVSSTLFSQSVKISSVVFPKCPPQSNNDGVYDINTVFILELYIKGTIDISKVSVKSLLPGEKDWVDVVEKMGSGKIKDSYVYMVNSKKLLKADFPKIASNGKVIEDSFMFFESGIKFRVFVDNKLVDVYGEGKTGKNTKWDFSASYAHRKNGKNPSTKFNISDWDIKPVGTLNGKGTCNKKEKLSTIITLGSDRALSVRKFSIENKVSLHKNPIKDKVVHFNSSVNLKEAIVYNIQGKEVSKFSIKNKSKINLDASLNSGVYFVKFISERNLSTIKKIIIL